jgi:hypothetical protein
VGAPVASGRACLGRARERRVRFLAFAVEGVEGVVSRDDGVRDGEEEADRARRDVLGLQRDGVGDIVGQPGPEGSPFPLRIDEVVEREETHLEALVVVERSGGVGGRDAQCVVGDGDARSVHDVRFPARDARVGGVYVGRGVLRSARPGRCGRGCRP